MKPANKWKDTLEINKNGSFRLVFASEILGGKEKALKKTVKREWQGSKERDTLVLSNVNI